MSYKRIDGKKLADELVDQIAQQIIEEGREPQLAVILAGNDPASHLYVKLKEKQCKKAGILFNKYLISETDTQEDLLKTIQFLNNDPTIDAILIQLPLPEKFDQEKAIEYMDYKKDVDGFHPKNVMNYLEGRPQKLLPGLSLAVWNLLASTGEKEYLGKSALIVGKSPHFTLPTKKLLTDNGVPTETIKPDDPNLSEKTRDADILITAIGKPKSVTKEMVKTGATIIDIGINKHNGKTVGDVDFDEVAPVCKFITPVPGGVGPMTVAMLLFNTLLLNRIRHTQL